MPVPGKLRKYVRKPKLHYVIHFTYADGTEDTVKCENHQRRDEWLRIELGENASRKGTKAYYEVIDNEANKVMANFKAYMVGRHIYRYEIQKGE